MVQPEPPTELIEFLKPYPDEVQQVALRAREALAEMLGPASEVFYDAVSAVCSGFTYTDSVTGTFVNLAVYSDHVTLIFLWGVNLDDPECRLKGEGTRVRHIRLAGIETMRDPYVAGLILQAEAKATRPEPPIEPRRIVKVMNGKKRRPSR
jgi:hypothetical protein